MVDKPDHSLWRQSRLLGVYLKGQAYNAAVVITEDPLRVWRAKIDEVTPLLDPIGSPAIAGFFSGAAGDERPEGLVDRRKDEVIVMPYCFCQLGPGRVGSGTPNQNTKYFSVRY